MRLIVGVQLDYDDVARLTRLRNYFKLRSRTMYLLVRWLIGEHFKAKRNAGDYGWYFVSWFSLPPLRFHLLYWAVRRQYFRVRHWFITEVLDYFPCRECNEMVPRREARDVGWIDYHGNNTPICNSCYCNMMSEYLTDEIEYVTDPWDADAPPLNVKNL
jgi:hypothetical protein